MTLDQVLNFAKVEVSTGYDASATSIVLIGGDGAKLPDPASGNYNLVWWDATTYGDPSDDPKKEIVRVTGKSTDTLTVVRNQESSGASTKNTAGRTYKMILAFTAKTYDDLPLNLLQLDQSTPQTIQGRPIIDDGISFGLTPTLGAQAPGKLYWNVTNQALSLDLPDGSFIDLGMDNYIYVYNNSGAPITSGKAVYISGGFNDVPTIALAKADIISTSICIGVTVTASIADSAYGYVGYKGHIHTIDTTAWAVGTLLYVSATTAGAITNTAPTGTNIQIYIGKVITQANPGVIFVDVTSIPSLSDLTDVNITSPVVDNVLRYNGTQWINGAGITVSGSLGIDFYNDEASILTTGNNNSHLVETLLKIPRTVGEQAEVVEAITTSSVLTFGEGYLYNVNLNRTTLDAGTWIFDTYCSVNTNTSGVPQIIRNVYRVVAGVGTLSTTGTGASRTATASTGTPFVSGDGTANISTCGYVQTPQGLYEITVGAVGGDGKVATITVPNGGTPYANETNIAAGNWKVWKKLFGSTLNIVSVGTDYGLISTQNIQGTHTLTADGTDRLGDIVFTTATGNKVINFVHNGELHASHVSTPLITLHGNLAGLQGGTGTVPTEQYYHLTAAEHTVVQNTSNTNTGDNTTATVEVVTDTASATTWPALYEAATGSIAVHTDAGLTYNASTANLTTTTFTGALAGNATTSTNTTGNAATVTVADESTDTSCFPLFATAVSGSLAPKTDSTLTYNSSTGLLGAMAVSITATDAANITALTVTQQDTSTAVAAMIVNAGTGDGLFIDQNGNGVGLHIDNDGTANSITVEGTTATDFVVLKSGNVGISITPTSLLHTAGSFATNLVTKAFADTGYTLTISDYTVLANAVGGAITLNLPTAVGIMGRIYVIKKTDSSPNIITIDGNGSETIDGATTQTINNQYEAIMIQSDNTNWMVI